MEKDNYKRAKHFERLAIKIVEEYLQEELDHQRTHTTQSSHDFGVDAVVFFKNDLDCKSRTIEAKLRKKTTTLELKDIASSVLLFLVRAGDEHYIVTNVYMTQGAIDSLESLSRQYGVQLFYIDAENTKSILTSILQNISEQEEKELAKSIISDFSSLKIPKKLSQRTSQLSKIDNKQIDITYPSRRVVEKDLLKKISNSYSLLLLKGAKGIGKHFVLENVKQILQKNNYIFVKLDVFQKNLREICYLLTSELLNIDITTIFPLLNSNDIKKIKKIFNDDEKNILESLIKVLMSEGINNESSFFLAKDYFNILFNRLSKFNYLIEIDNLSYASEEVFNFITTIAHDLPPNVKIVGIIDNNYGSNNVELPLSYKLAYQGKYFEIELEDFKQDEAIEFLNEHLNEYRIDVSNLYSVLGGNPLILKNAVQKITEFRGILPINFYNQLYMSMENIYVNIVESSIHSNSCLNKLFFIVQIIDTPINFFKLNLLYESNYLTYEEYEEFKKYLKKSELFKEANGNYIIRTPYIKMLIEAKILSCKDIFYKYALQYVNTIGISELNITSKIILFYLINSSEIISLYDIAKENWEFKADFQWKVRVLKYVSNFILENQCDSIQKYILKARIFTEYLHYCHITFSELSNDVIPRELEDVINYLETNFMYFEKSVRNEIAHILANYYIYIYSDHKTAGNFIYLFNIFNNIEDEPWFDYLKTKEKCILIRYKALLYKENGNRNVFDVTLNKLYSKYQSDPYAVTVYWANRAAAFYTSDSEKALKYIKKCPLNSLIEAYPEEASLALWIENDKAIVLFMMKQYMLAEEILHNVIKKAKRINDLENLSRAYNLLGLIQIAYHNTDAISSLHSAICHAAGINDNTFIQFAINYLTELDLPNNEMTTEIFSYFNKEHIRLKNVVGSKAPENNRWLVAIIAFSNYLQKNDRLKYYKFKELYHDAILLKNKISKKYIINKNLYVFF